MQYNIKLYQYYTRINIIVGCMLRKHVIFNWNKSQIGFSVVEVLKLVIILAYKSWSNKPFV